MRAYRDISIRHKLQGIVLVSCGVALLVSAAAFTLYDRTTFLRAKTNDLRTSAKMIGSNSTAALTFHDSKSAQETLSALQAIPHVMRACIYDSDGKVFAKYSRDPSEIGACPLIARGEGSAVVARRMFLCQNIGLNGESVGSIYIEADLADLEERSRRFMVIDALVLLASLAVALVLSYRLQRVISEPIRELAKTASAVSAQKNYSIRAIKRGQDEIGGLFDQFNGMLDRIQQRDVALQKAHDELEIRVEERTSYLNALIETSPLAIMVLDSAEKVQLCNPAFERLFQWARQELIGKPAHEMLADGQLLLQAHTNPPAALGGALVNLATQRKRKDGSLVDVEVHAVPLVVKGRVVGSLSIYQDISVRKRAEEELYESRQMLQSILDAIPQRVFWKDRNISYLGCNQAFAMDAGLKDPAEIIGKSDYELAWSETAELYRADDKLVMERATPRLNFDETQSRPDGSLLWLRTSKLPLRDREGKVIGVIGTYEDITERKLVELALQESEEQFRQLAENIHEVFFIFAAEPERTVYLSPAYEQIWGRPRQEAYQRATAWLESVHPEEREPTIELFRRCLSGAQLETEFRVIRPDGDIRWIHARCFPVCDSEGKFLRTVGIAEDITEQRRVLEAVRAAQAAAEAASRVKSEFLANMSHEIRTPMNGILGMTELALDTDLTQEQREYLTAVKSSGDALLRVLNDILDFSKVEAGKLDLELIEFSLQDCVGETVKALAVRAHEKGLELAYQVGPEVPQRVVGDPVRLRQILTNLVGNAIKFTPEGEVVLTLSAAPGDNGKISLNFTIKDTGIGIPPEKQVGIFQPFVQADASTTRTYGGTGLGLAISAQLIALMGGQVSVESAQGEGSCFQFTIPVAVAQETTQRPVLDRPEILVGVPVLIVDDNPTNREILVHVTRDWGMAPSAVGDGEAAIREMESALQQAKAYRVALIDVHMPGMDGFELAERLQHDPRMAGAVIMMLTSSGQRGDAARCRQLGIAAYLVKPIGSNELMQALLAVLGHNAALGHDAEVVRPLVTRHTLREDHRGLRILVAEDNPVNQALILRVLQKQGHVPELASNGREAVALAATGRFDLAFMDVQMPEMDGFAATAAIREREKVHGAHLPIYAMTAHAIKGDKERCLAAGMDGYISKPVEFSKIQQVLDGVRPQPPYPTPVWDHHQALSGVGGDEQLLREIAEMFLQGYPQAVSDLRRALAGRDAEMLGRIAHRLKGEVGCFGAGPSLSALVKLEEDVAHPDFEPMSRAVDEVERELACLRQALEEFGRVPHESLSR